MARQLARLVADAVKRRGTTVYLRTTVPAQNGGPVPPVLDAPVLHAEMDIGDTTLSVDASAATGKLSAGDEITAAGQTFTVQAAITARAPGLGVVGGFDGVTVTPAATAAIAAGTTLAFTWAADAPIKAILQGYPVNLVDGDNIAAADLKVRIAAWNQPQPDPALQKIVFGGRARTIINVLPVYGVAGELEYWDLQTR